MVLPFVRPPSRPPAGSGQESDAASLFDEEMEEIPREDQQERQQVAVVLEVDAEGSVRLALAPGGGLSLPADCGGSAADMELGGGSDSSSLVSSTSSSSGDEGEVDEEDEEAMGAEITNYEQLRAVVAAMDDDEDEGGGGGGVGTCGQAGPEVLLLLAAAICKAAAPPAAGHLPLHAALPLVNRRPCRTCHRPPPAAHRAEQELLGSAPPPSLEGLTLEPGDAISPAGMLQSILEGVIVVRVSRVDGAREKWWGWEGVGWCVCVGGGGVNGWLAREGRAGMAGATCGRRGGTACASPQPCTRWCSPTTPHLPRPRAAPGHWTRARYWSLPSDRCAAECSPTQEHDTRLPCHCHATLLWPSLGPSQLASSHPALTLARSVQL